jgi:hypothetical protein
MPPYDNAPPGPPPSGEPASPAPEKQHKRSGSNKRRRTHFVQVALDAAEYADAKTRAQRVGLSLASYARLGMIGTPGPRARRTPRVHAPLLGRAMAEINKSSNVLNQFLPFLHAGRAVTLGRECSEALAANKRAADAILEAVGRTERNDDHQREPA